MTANTPTIGIMASSDEHARACADAIKRLGGRTLRIDPVEDHLPKVSLGLVDALVCGDDADLTREAVILLRAALDDDMPVYALGDGMLLLNGAFSGKGGKEVPQHSDADENGSETSAYHHIYIAPGSRLAAVVGSGGFVRVNCRHRQGLREAQKSPQLLASAYSLEDGVIEALESSRHRWVIGVQFRPERRMEVPPHFDRLFQSLLERAAERMNSPGFAH